MFRSAVLILVMAFLFSCSTSQAIKEQQVQRDRAACIASGKQEGSEALKQCMDILDTKRADQDVKRMQRDLDEYERLRQDRLNEHLSHPVIR